MGIVLKNVNITGGKLNGVVAPPPPPPPSWTRPSDWLTMPTVTSAQQTFVGLHAVFPSGNNFAAFRFTTSTGQYQVDWGDGVVDLVNSNVVAEHTYDYSTYDPTNLTLSTRGYKQAIITVTPVTGNLLTCNFQFRRTTVPSQNQAYATGFLDCILSMPFASSGASVGFGGDSVIHGLIERFDIKTIGGCTSLLNLFRQCRSLQLVPLFDTSNSINMQSMFINCQSLQSVPLFDTLNVTTMREMFQGCISLQLVPLFDTSNVTSMLSTFSSCTTLQSVPLFDTSNVIDMTNMFINCQSLQSVPLFDTSNVISIRQMFDQCRSLKNIPLFDTSNVTDMFGTFASCTTLQSVPLFDTSNATNMNAMFSNCTSLQSVPLFNTQNVINMTTMLQGCPSLNESPAFDTTSVTSQSNQFSFCGSFDKTDIVCRVSVGFLNCQLSQSELVNIFNNLLDRTSLAAANINITGNWGATALTVGERAIATSKNWTITG